MHDDAEKWAAARTKIIAFADRAAGWDSYGAAPPSSLAIERALELIGVLAFLGNPPPIGCVLTSAGGVALEWWGDVVEIHPNGTVTTEKV